VKFEQASCNVPEEDGGTYVGFSFLLYQGQPGLKLNQAEQCSLFSSFPLQPLLSARRLGSQMNDSSLQTVKPSALALALEGARVTPGSSLLSERSALEKEGKDVKNVVAMLSSLCNT